MCEDLWYFGKIFVYGSQFSFSPGVRKIKGLTSRFSESFIFKQTGSDKFREKRTGKSRGLQMGDRMASTWLGPRELFGSQRTVQEWSPGVLRSEKAAPRASEGS